MKFEVKNRWTGNVQFTADINCQESDSYLIKLGLAVSWAVQNNADLRCAYLEGADLEGADLRGADLRGADLRGANLRGADLEGAYLRGADLRFAYLEGADLRGAYLIGADLGFADLGCGIKRFGYVFKKTPVFIRSPKYNIEIWEGFVKICCEKHTLDEWKSFTDKEIIHMYGKDVPDWWKKWKPVILATAKAEGLTKLPEKEVE